MVQSHIEKGDRKASMATFVKIVRFMKISLDYIILGIDEQKEAVNPYDTQLAHRISPLSDKEKIFVLDFIVALKNFNK